MSELHLFGFLSQTEWKACYALVFAVSVGEYRDAYPLHRYRTDDAEEGLLEQFRQAVRFLASEHGVRFRALAVDEVGTILVTQENYVAPANLGYWLAFQSGSLPGSPLAALDAAIPWLPSVAPDFDVEPLVALREDVRRQCEEALADTPPEVFEAYRRGEAMAKASLATTPPEVN